MLEERKLCDECGQKPAVYYTKKIMNGKVIERYLCEDCKNKHGFIKQEVGFDNLFSALASPFFGAFSAPKKNASCSCGTTLNEYLETGFLGCPECYNTFQNEILSSVQRLQKDTTHIGKVPGTMLSDDERKYSELLKAREDAVAREDYEKASVINEQMKEIKQKLNKGGGINGR